MTPPTQGALLDPPVRAGDHTRGALTAPITLLQYGDYECPACGQAHALVQGILRQLGERLCFVYRHFAPAGLHPHARQAAEAAEAAGAQGRFWQMHDTLFAHQQALENGFLVEYADALGLDTTRFLRDMAGHVHAERVRGDTSGAVRSGVLAAPTFFINGVRYIGTCDEQALLAAAQEAATPREGTPTSWYHQEDHTDGAGRHVPLRHTQHSPPVPNGTERNQRSL